MSGTRQRSSKTAEEMTSPKPGSVEDKERSGRSGTGLALDEVRRACLLAAAAAVELKAEDARLLDVHEVVSYTDFLVICTGRNTRLTRRIAEEVAQRLKREKGLLPVGQEGSADGSWLLLDYLDFVVHVFTPEAREFYRLESLWKQAPAEHVS